MFVLKKNKIVIKKQKKTTKNKYMAEKKKKSIKGFKSHIQEETVLFSKQGKIYVSKIAENH